MIASYVGPSFGRHHTSLYLHARQYPSFITTFPFLVHSYGSCRTPPISLISICRCLRIGSPSLIHWRTSIPGVWTWAERSLPPLCAATNGVFVVFAKSMQCSQRNEFFVVRRCHLVRQLWISRMTVVRSMLSMIICYHWKSSLVPKRHHIGLLPTWTLYVTTCFSASVCDLVFKLSECNPSASSVDRAEYIKRWRCMVLYK